MVPAWTVTLSYLGYSIMLAIGAGVWLAALADVIIYDRVETGRLDRGWLDVAHALTRNANPALWTALALGGAAFLLALLPAAEGAPETAGIAKAHKAYLLRYGAVALAFLILTGLTTGRMGGFDADVGSAVLFAWSLWILVAGWRAWAGGAAAAGPALWWLALIADLLLIGLFAFFWIMIEIQGFRLF